MFHEMNEQKPTRPIVLYLAAKIEPNIILCAGMGKNYHNIINFYSYTYIQQGTRSWFIITLFRFF